MLLIAGFFLGALFGGWRARSKGGDRLDMAQYAAIHGILLALLVLVFGVILGRIYGF